MKEDQQKRREEKKKGKRNVNKSNRSIDRL